MERSVPFIARSITVRFPFAARFLKRAPVARVERGTFLLTPTVPCPTIAQRVSASKKLSCKKVLKKRFV